MTNPKNRFNWSVRPLAYADNILSGSTCRFTVLSSRLIRMEYSPDSVFEDRASQVAFYRDFPKCTFSHEIKDGVLTLTTEHLLLRCRDGVPFSPDTLEIKLLNEPGATWRYGDPIEDLGGTARTLDMINEGCPLDRGVCSRLGFSVIDDSLSLLLDEEEWIGVRRENTSDLYFFGFGYDYIGAVKALYQLTGAPPLLPSYALGNWWSRYHAYTQQEYLELMDRFTEEDLPFCVSVVDMDWHITKIPDDKRDPLEKNIGWTGYSWNKELFPDYKEFLRQLKKRGLKTALNLHPADGTHPHEDMYEEMAIANGIDPSTKRRVPLDILSKKHMESYFDILHHPYEEDGVDFWWMDWQQGTDYWWIHEPNKEGEYADPRERMDPLWMLNHLHILDISRSGKRPMFFSRYAGPGSHRYPVGFSGDTLITWESLKFQPYFTATASNIGYCWWSHDIGGHMLGERDDELFVRWEQLGVFSPINRLHSSYQQFIRKEPWLYGSVARDALGNSLRLRHKLYPYLYTMNYRTHEELLPLVQPMYYHYPKLNTAYSMPNQFFFGSELMVAPITEKCDGRAGLAKTEVWLPEGSWFDLFSGMHYASGNRGRKITVCRDLNTIPVFAKQGAIVPLAKHRPKDNSLINSPDMELLVFPGKSNSFTLIEDSGDMMDYKSGAVARTNITLDYGKSAELTISGASGDLSLIPEVRCWKICLRGFNKGIKVSAKVDGVQREITPSRDEKSNTTVVEISAKVTSTVTLEINGEDLIHDNSDYLERAKDLIQKSQYSHTIKDRILGLMTDEMESLAGKCMFLAGDYQDQRMLTLAVQELLTLTEDRFLGKLI